MASILLHINLIESVDFSISSFEHLTLMFDNTLLMRSAYDKLNGLYLTSSV